MAPKAINPATTITPTMMPKVRLALPVEAVPLSVVVESLVMGDGFDVDFGVELAVDFGVGEATGSVSFSRLNVRFTCLSRLNERVLLRLLLSSVIGRKYLSK